jgi:hypothetical protein
MRAGSRQQNPLATMLCNFKARAAGGRVRRPSRRALVMLIPLSGQVLRSSKGDPSSNRQPRRVFRPPCSRPLCRDVLNDRSSVKTRLIRQIARPRRREIFSRWHPLDRSNPASLAQRQQAQSGACSIDRNQSAAAQLLLGLMNGSKHGWAEEFGCKKIAAQ